MIQGLPVDANPTCAAPRHRPLVDEAFEQPGGSASHQMRQRLCPTCPHRLQCLLLGNAGGEHGVWGGLSTNQRVTAGGRSARDRNGNLINLRGIDHGRYPSGKAA